MVKVAMPSTRVLTEPGLGRRPCLIEQVVVPSTQRKNVVIAKFTASIVESPRLVDPQVRPFVGGQVSFQFLLVAHGVSVQPRPTAARRARETPEGPALDPRCAPQYPRRSADGDKT